MGHRVAVAVRHLCQGNKRKSNWQVITIINMSRKCSRLSHNLQHQPYPDQPKRPASGIHFKSKISITEPIQPINRHQSSERQRTKQYKARSLSQIDAISISKRLNSIIRGRPKRSNTEHLITSQDAQSQASILNEVQKKRIKQQKRMQFGKKLLLLCKKSKEQEEDDISGPHYRVKTQVKQQYEFKTLNKRATNESLLLDFNKNQHGMYSRSRKKVIEVEKEENKLFKQKQVSSNRKFSSFQSIFYRSYLTKFKDRRKLLKGKHTLMKIVAS